MSFEAEFNSTNPSKITNLLYLFLNKETDADVLALNAKFNALRTAEEKSDFMREFETSTLRKSKLESIKHNPQLLNKWQRFCLLRSTLAYLAHQKANNNSTLSEGIAEAIQEDVVRGVPIDKSISTLKKVNLQLVGTEHPTDPFSQEFSNGMQEIATAIDACNPEAIQEAIRRLQLAEVIPFAKRTVAEEVQRTLTMTLDKLYDNIPAFMESILHAYESAYGSELFHQYQENIKQALIALIDDATWAGFDADGNIAVTPLETQKAINAHRVHATKKHTAALDKIIITINMLKRIELLMGTATSPMQALIIELENFKKQLALKKSTEEKVPESKKEVQDLLSEKYEKILQSHHLILAKLPAIQKQLYFFGIQLRCYGSTFGSAHIRQDSSVHQKVWNDIFKILRQDKRCRDNPLICLLDTKKYEELSTTEKNSLHRHLLVTADGKVLLKIIKEKFDANVWKTPEFAVVQRELERYYLAVKNKNMIKKIIISNAEESCHLFEAESLKSIFSSECPEIAIVPLLEKKEDLENYENILTPYMLFRMRKELENAFNQEEKIGVKHLKEILGITTRDELVNLIRSRPQVRKLLHDKPNLRPYFEKIFEVMFGFSDSERVSGPGALVTIQKIQEAFIRLANEFGLRPKLFYGPGGDLGRGVLYQYHETVTFQGVVRLLLLTPAGTQRVREKQFYSAYKTHANPLLKMEFATRPDIHQAVREYEAKSTAFYEQLFNPRTYGQLWGVEMAKVSWLVNRILNSSSRAPERKVEDLRGDRTASMQTGGARPSRYITVGNLRAITFSQISEVFRQYSNIIMGPCYAFRQLGKAQFERLYDQSLTIQITFKKLMLAIALIDFSITEQAIFGEDSRYRLASVKQKQAWAAECREQFPDLLEKMSIEELLKTNPRQVDDMLPKFFAFLEEEYKLTQQFIFEMEKRFHGFEYKQFKKIHTSKETKDSPTHIFFAYPEIKNEVQEKINNTESSSRLLSRVNTLVSESQALDAVYPGLNAAPCIGDEKKLSGVGTLVATLGVTTTLFRAMPATFPDMHDSKNIADLRPGVARAEQEARKYNIRMFNAKEVATALQNKLGHKTTVKKITSRL